MKINLFDLGKLSKAEIKQILRRSEIDITDLQERVKPIIAAVMEQGDPAIRNFNQTFDQVTVKDYSLKATAIEFEQARQTLSEEIKEVIQAAAQNIKKFHQAQMPEEMWFTQMDDGVIAGEKITPIHSIGLYVPRGKGAFPSVMLMLGIPAIIAKVPKVIVCTPPKPDGTVDDATLFSAEICGISDVYKVGGAQAIAAMAYGTESIPSVKKILGPGNSYVSAAKRLLYGTIDVGLPAGPSEAIILCDEKANAKTAALDLLIEAEHGPDSCALLVTHSKELANQVRSELPGLIQGLLQERKDFCTKVFSNYGGIVLTSNLQHSIQFVNDFAPEHLEVLTEEPMAILPKIIHAGEILLGPHTPITLGNFCLGVNAILPTGGFAKTFSCVTVFDFLKRTSIGYATKDGYQKLSGLAQKFAEYEGFSAHARAIRERN